MWPLNAAARHVLDDQSWIALELSSDVFATARNPCGVSTAREALTREVIGARPKLSAVPLDRPSSPRRHAPDQSKPPTMASPRSTILKYGTTRSDDRVSLPRSMRSPGARVLCCSENASSRGVSMLSPRSPLIHSTCCPVTVKFQTLRSDTSTSPPAWVSNRVHVSIAGTPAYTT